MTDVTGSNASGGAKPRKTAAPKGKTGFAAVDEEARILESTAVQGQDATPGDLGVSQHGDMSSPGAADRAEVRSSGGSAGAFAGGASGGTAGAGTDGGLSEEDSVALAALEAAQARARTLRDWALTRRDEARDAVRMHPIGSSAIVFGAGMIFGLLLARR